MAKVMTRGMRVPTKKGGRPTNRPRAEVLAILYTEMTATEIGELYGVAPRTVRGWLTRYRKEYRQMTETKEKSDERPN